MPPTLEQNQNTTNTIQSQPSIKTEEPSIKTAELMPTKPFVLPAQQTPPLATVPDVTSLVAQNEKLFAPDQTAQAERDAAQRGLLQAFNDLGGRADLRTKQENLQGINQKREALNTSNTELQMLQAEQDTLNERLQADSRGRGITAGGLAPIQTAQQRDLAVRTRFAVAKNLAIQGNLALAQQNVQQAVDDKFADQQTKVANAQSQLNFIQQKINEGAITRTKAVDQALAERNRIIAENQKKIDEQKEEQKNIQNLALKAISFGADADTLAKIQKAKTVDEAISLAGTSLRDPKFKFELEKIKLDIEQTKLQNAKIAKETALLGQPTPEEEKRIQKALVNEKTSIPAMQDKITLVDALNKSAGFSSRVGTIPFSRKTDPDVFDYVKGIIGGGIAGSGVGLAFGGVGAIPGAIGGAILGGASVGASSLASLPSDISGSGQNFAGGVHKLVTGLSLQALIQAKEQGATFGALSDSELRILANSATAINDWEIWTKDGKVVPVGTTGGAPTGVWNIDEDSFKKELATIQELTQRAIRLKTENMFSPDEKSALNNIFDAKNTISPADYFQSP